VPQAYTPGLRVTPRTRIRKHRRLPLEGDVLVSVGDAVTRDQVVARADLPGNVTTLNLVNRLGCSAEELPDFMLKQEGDPIEIEEPIAETRPLIKWFKTTVNAPISGTIESISRVTGQVLMREPPNPVELRAYVNGTIVDVIAGQGVDLETEGAYIQGIFGVGGESGGPLRILTDTPSEDFEPRQITAQHQNEVIVVGGRLSIDTIRAAQSVGASAIIGGCIRDSDLRELLGHDLGVAITGQEDLGPAVVITEGFGQIRMADRTFGLLKTLAGQDASVSGATQIRAGVLRPEIIVPKSGDSLAPGDQGETDESSEGMKAGDPLRVIRAPHFGRIGRVSDLIPELRRVESGAFVRVLEVAFDDSERAVVPRANVELIEE